MRKLLIAGLLALTSCICYPAAAQECTDADSVSEVNAQLKQPGVSVGDLDGPAKAAAIAAYRKITGDDSDIDQVELATNQGVVNILFFFDKGCMVGRSKPLDPGTLAKVLGLDGSGI